MPVTVGSANSDAHDIDLWTPLADDNRVFGASANDGEIFFPFMRSSVTVRDGHTRPSVAQPFLGR